jgi:hypothetical protein
LPIGKTFERLERNFLPVGRSAEPLG